MKNKYYSTDLSIPIIEIKADSKAEAEAVMQRFIDLIGVIMTDDVRWEECDWTVDENILDEANGVWNVK